MSNKTRHTAFLVRWQDEGEGARWRSTVENAYTGQKLHFSNKSELLRFLWQSLYPGKALKPSGEDKQEAA